MAYQHNPGYGTAPYGYQPPYHQPQPNLQQHNYGTGGFPVGPAPSQAYMQSRPSMFPTSVPQQMAQGNMIPRPPPTYHAQYPNNAPAFQHNAQFEASSPGLHPHAAIPNQHNFYQPQAFPHLHVDPNAAMPASRPPLIPPPPQAASQVTQGIPPATQGIWPLNNPTPPNHVHAGQSDAVPLLTGQGRYNYQAPLEKNIEGSRGEVTNGTHHGSNAVMLHPQTSAAQSYSIHDQMLSMSARNTYKAPEESKSKASSLVEDNAANSGLIELPKQEQLHIQTSKPNASPSPDMYSPQSNTGGLPGLDVEYSNIGQKRTRKDSETGSGRSQQPGEARQMSGNGYESKNQASEKPSVPSSISYTKALTPINPFILKQNALSALKDLSLQHLSFTDIVSQGVDSEVLHSLYRELGLSIQDDTDPRTKENPAIATEAESLKLRQMEPSKVGPEVVNTTTVKTLVLKPPTREEYLARLAAASDKIKASAQNQEPYAASKDIGSNEDTVESATSPVAALDGANKVKKSESKGLSMTDRVRQKLEALRKSTREKEEAARANQADLKSPVPVVLFRAGDAKANGEYTPANPFFSPEKVSAGIPGLSMFEEPDLSREAESELPALDIGEGFDMSTKEAVSGTEGVSEPRKRSLEPDRGEMTPDQNKLRGSSPSQSQYVIELSDDEDGEVNETVFHPPMQRSYSSSSHIQDGPQSRPTSQAQQQFRPRELAAREEEIRLYRQRIAALEAKKRAKKAVASLVSSPAPGTSDIQTLRTLSTPELQRAVDQKSDLAAVGDQVQAQQQSLEAVKSVVKERLEKEVQAYRIVTTTAGPTEGLSLANESERTRRQQRIESLRGSLKLLNEQISQAETELVRVRKQEQALQAELERGLKGRESFTKELQALIDSMIVEDAAEDATMEQSPDDEQTEHGAHFVTSTLDESQHAEAMDGQSRDSRDDVDDVSTDAEDATMDISDVEEGEVSELESGEEASRPFLGSSNPTMNTYEAEHVPGLITSVSASLSNKSASDEESSMDVEDEYEPKEDKHNDHNYDREDGEDDVGEDDVGGKDTDADDDDDDESMDYEPDYEPELELESGPVHMAGNSSEADTCEPPKNPEAVVDDEEFQVHEDSSDGFSADLMAELASPIADDQDLEGDVHRQLNDVAQSREQVGDGNERGTKPGLAQEEDESEDGEISDEDDPRADESSAAGSVNHPNNATSGELPGLDIGDEQDEDADAEEEEEGDLEGQVL